MSQMNRREALRALAAAVSALGLSGTLPAHGLSTSKRTRLGMAVYALRYHRQYKWEGRHEGLSPTLALLEECRRLGAGGVQCPLRARDESELQELRGRAEQYQMHVEAIIQPPRDTTDVQRFEQEVRMAKEAGANLARTVIIPGRRYERFHSLAEYHTFEQRGLRALERAEPVLARHRFRLAVENHKDQRVAEKLETIKRLSSDYIGLCVDVGNNFPLMEDPLETARALAPWALTVHLKDQAVREYEEGYLLADVALGEGFLDLPAIVSVLRDAKPNIKFHFESITRDAIRVPILTDGFWATLRDTPASALARTLRILKTQSHAKPFPLVSKLSRERQLALERQNVERSIAYAINTLEL